MTWCKNLKMAMKLGIGFGIVLCLMIGIAIVGDQALSMLSEQMNNYAQWGDIDMVMNEDVIQNVVTLETAAVTYILDSQDANWPPLQSAMTQCQDGLNEWKTLIAKNADLTQAAADIDTLLNEYTQKAEQLHSNALQRETILTQWDSTAQSSIATLLNAMETIIDPAKGAAEEEKNIEKMVLWGEIDMIMNESVIQNVLLLQMAAHDYASHKNSESWTAFQNRLTETQQGLMEWKERLTSQQAMIPIASAIQKELDQFRLLGNQYNHIVEESTKLQNTLKISTKTLLSTLDKAMEEVIDPAKDAAIHQVAQIQEKADGLILFTAILAILAGGFIAYNLARNICASLKKGVDFAHSISQGDLTKIIDLDQKDEIGDLANALRHMAESLTDLIQNIQQSAEQVASSSEELSASSQNLASSSTEQASTLEETSSSIDSLMNSIQDIASLSGKANQKSSKATQSADEGGTAVVQTVDAMKTIADKICIINDIADQTNLLALNAAIEAARAGEMGKGFAVVAIEVRKLAERSQLAAKEISELASRSVIQAESAGSLIQEVVETIQETSQLVQIITNSSSEQAQSSQLLRASLSQLDTITQQNSATSEEAASASEELAAQAQALQEMVSQFVIHKQSPKYSPSLKSNSSRALVMNSMGF